MCIFKEILIDETTKILHKLMNNYTNSTVPAKILVADKLSTELPTFYITCRYINP
jgi:hypothetical protein